MTLQETPPTPTAHLKICTQCKFIATNGRMDVETFRCFAPQNSFRINLVDGSKIHKTPYCASHRAIDTNGQLSDVFCTVDGNWFEAAPAKEAALVSLASGATFERKTKAYFSKVSAEDL